jgi:hypothetical protein
MIDSISKLIYTIEKWFITLIPDNRVDSNDSKGRSWVSKALEYDKTFKLEDLREYTDRSELNRQYVAAYKVEDPKQRKGISGLKADVSSLYSFNKCFVQRYKGRMHYYRDDLSQKGQRNMRTVGQSLHLLELFKSNLES